jgi:hypothetical protein
MGVNNPPKPIAISALIFFLSFVPGYNTYAFPLVLSLCTRFLSLDKDSSRDKLCYLNI